MLVFDPVGVKIFLKKHLRIHSPDIRPVRKSAVQIPYSFVWWISYVFFGTHVLVLCCNMNDISICSVESYLVNAAYFGCNQ